MAHYDCSDLADDLCIMLWRAGVPIQISDGSAENIAAVLRECVIVHKDDPRAERMLMTQLPPMSTTLPDDCGAGLVVIAAACCGAFLLGLGYYIGNLFPF